MLGLFQAFSLRCAQINEAIRLGDDARVSSLDRHVDGLVEAIIGYRAENLLYIHMQLQFVGCLIDQYADDSEYVREHVKLLSHLMEQYFGTPLPGWRMTAPVPEPISVPGAYVPNTDNGNFLNAAILETLPDRVAVLTRDYRYLYSNSANSDYLGRKPMEMIGRHIMEFIGEKRFNDCVKAKLDACFAGEGSEHSYERMSNGLVEDMRCRMSPLKDASGSVIGALIILEKRGAKAVTLAA